MINDKVSEEVRELVYSDYNNKYEQLKSELKEIEYGCGRTYYKNTSLDLVCGQMGEYKGNDVLCPTCQAKIEYLKKGISACEEMLKLKDEWKSEWELEFKRIYNKKLKQSLSQRNQEILEILNKYKNTFCDLCEEDYQKLKKQLTNSEEGKE